MSTLAPVVDAHHHLWEVGPDDMGWTSEFPVLHRSFRLAELEPELAGQGVDATVLVQSLADLQETREMLALAAGSAVVAGVVGWVDLAAPDVAEQLAGLAEGPGGERLVGIRHLVQAEPDPRWLLRPEVLRGLQEVAAAGLAYDLLIRAHQLPVAVEVARALPHLRLVLDHGGQPAIAFGSLEPWASDIAALAAHPNVACKLSGLVTQADASWTVDEIRPYAAHLVDVFGADRLMAGSDWPVCLLRATYGEVAILGRELIGTLSAADQARVLGGTAIERYRLALQWKGSDSA